MENSFPNSLKMRIAIKLAKDNGAKGITFFDGSALNAEHIKTIRRGKESFK